MPEPTIPPPTAEQHDIIHAFTDSTDNVIVNALAGTGKTTLIEMVARSLPREPILYLAFNKRIVTEAEKRMPPNTICKTQNSLGHRAWGEAIGKRLTIETKKSGDFCKMAINELGRRFKEEAWDDFGETLRWIASAKRDGYVPPGNWPPTYRPAFANAAEWLAGKDDRPTSLQMQLVDDVLARGIRAAYEGLIDFDDQIYMPVLFGGTWPKFPLVLIDEAQDWGPLGHIMLSRLVVSRLGAVGDPWQCHPPGTMITMTGGIRRRIEDIRIGDQLVSYFTNKSVFKGLRNQGRLVEHVNVSDFDGELVRVTIGNTVLRMTPNHKCLVRMTKEQGYALYLMQRGNQYRIGISRLAYQDGSGVSMRARQERADRAWILSTYPSKEIAHVFENAYSGFFGLPQLLFEDPNVSIYGKANLDAAWGIIGDNTERAQTCLKHFGRLWEHPIWSTDGINQHFGSKSFITQACNLIGGMMMCHMSLEPRAVGADKSGIWRHIEQPRREPYKGPVYGLTVEPTEGGRRLYLANDIVVHNSIYAFKGAVCNGMAQLRERWSMREFPLSVTWRVPKRGVERANARVPSYRAADTNPEGAVHELEEWGPQDIPAEAAIICRNNAPLLSLGFKLLHAGRPIKLVGFDIGSGLVRVLRKLGPPDLSAQGIAAAIDKWLDTQLAGNKPPESVYDRAECLRALTQGRDTLQQAINHAEALFKREGPLQLMSGHKSKGLEFDNVFHLDPWRIPSRFAKEGEALEQELNIRYVIETRFKLNLYLVSLETYQGD